MLGLMEEWQTMDEVRALIKAAEGPSALARKMGFSRQRVANWLVKGRVPAMVVKGFRPLFRRVLAKATKEVS